MRDASFEADHHDGADIGELRAALAESKARLTEARGELARLVRLAEADLGRVRPGETSSVLSAAVRRPGSKEVATRIARLVELFKEAAAVADDQIPAISEQTLREWLEASGLFDRRFYLTCNADVAGSGTDPFHHYYHHGAAEARLPSAL